jgi:hypothetical protein
MDPHRGFRGPDDPELVSSNIGRGNFPGSAEFQLGFRTNDESDAEQEPGVPGGEFSTLIK